MTRPLIVTDCDGVLLHFIAPFVAYLEAEHDLTLRMESFALTGNVRRRDGTPIAADAFPPLLDAFFTTHMDTQSPLPGAVEALTALSRDCDIVVLTNVASHHAEQRALELRRFGMPYRVIGNQGPKGAPLKALVDEYRPSAAVFIDDLPPHHRSAKSLVPDVHRLHMVVEDEVRAVIPAAPEADARIDDWATALTHIQTVIGARS